MTPAGGLFRTGLLCALLMTALQSFGETWRLFEDRIDLNTPVAGDAFLLANDVTLSGTFSEDVWAAGRKIDFSGVAQDDVRVMGMELVKLNGAVGGDVRMISHMGNVVLSTNAVVAADAILQAGKRISLNGQVKGNVWAEAPRIVVDGQIGGNLTVKGKNIQFLPGAVISGNLINLGSQPLPIPKGVTVLGERLQETEAPSELASSLKQLGWALRILQFVTAALIGLLMLRVFPKFTGQNIDLLMSRQGPLLTIGLFSFIVLLLSGYVLLFTVIGTGVGLFMLLVTGLLFYLGKIVTAYVIGLVLLRQTSDLAFGKLALALILGLVVLYTFSAIPYIGGSLYLLASCWGMGAMLVSLRISQKALHFHIPSSTPPHTP